MPRISIDIDVKSLTPLLARLDLMPMVLTGESRKAMAESVEIVKQAVEIRTPIGEQLDASGTVGASGHLRSSIHGESAFGLFEVTGHIFTEVRYAPWVEDGHGPIVPLRPGGWLRFRPKGAAHMIYSRYVRPTSGVHMFRLGLMESRGAIIDRFEEAMRAVARFVAGK